jgi:site-specific DNA-cytosine methylase
MANWATALLGGITALSVAKYIEFLERFKNGEVKSNKSLTYVSLFSGIGGFELGIASVFPKAKCIAYSEIDQTKITVYERHFDHENLGDISSVPINQLKQLKADLLVGGFSCKSKSVLSVIARKDKEDISADTFDYTLNVLRNGKFKDFILENVPTAATSELSTEDIVRKLKEVTGQNVYHKIVQACFFTGTSRKRSIFTSFPLKITIPDISKRFEFALDPFSEVEEGFLEEVPENIHYWAPKTVEDKGRPLPRNYLNPFEYKTALNEFMNAEKRTDRWSFVSDTNKKCSATILRKSGTYPPGLIIDRRGGQPLVRYMTINEGERLMGFPVGWTGSHSKTKAFQCLGDAVVVDVIKYVMLNYLYDKSSNKFDTYLPYSSRS